MSAKQKNPEIAKVSFISFFLSAFSSSFTKSTWNSKAKRSRGSERYFRFGYLHYHSCDYSDPISCIPKKNFQNKRREARRKGGERKLIFNEFCPRA